MDKAALPPAGIALVTGASRGIGHAIALGLADAGLDVALMATNAQALLDVKQEVEARGRRAISLPADVTDAAQVRRAVEAAGPVDLLVNAAGVVDAEVPAWQADPDKWWRTVEVNIRGPFVLAQALVPGMLARGGGRIVNLNSGLGARGAGVASGYNVGKTGAMRLGEHLHEAGFAQGLRSFEVAPGVVATDMATGMDMHVGRTQWTPVEYTVNMVVAIASGALDMCSGWFIRVTDDTPQSLQELAASGLSGSDDAGSPAAGSAASPVVSNDPRRRLRVHRASPKDWI